MRNSIFQGGRAPFAPFHMVYSSASDIKSILCLLLLWDQGSKLQLIRTVANAINILLLVTKNSPLVANMATAFLCANDE